MAPLVPGLGPVTPRSSDRRRQHSHSRGNPWNSARFRAPRTRTTTASPLSGDRIAKEARAAAARRPTLAGRTTSRSTGQDCCFATKPAFRRCSIEAPLAIELDESEQRPSRGAANPLAAPFHGCGRLRPYVNHARSGRQERRACASRRPHRRVRPRARRRGVSRSSKSTTTAPRASTSRHRRWAARAARPIRCDSDAS